VKHWVDGEVEALARAAEDLRDAAPAPDADGWSHARDPEAVDAMRAAWRRARVAYEHVEGAIAILFPETDVAIDARFERYAEQHLDARPFDGNGFVGMHAIERILWSDAIPPAALAFERPLTGYFVARTPESAPEATAFRDELCAHLVHEVRTMQEQLAPLALDDATAWRGIEGSVEEQSEKVLLGTTGQDESRYAAITLADMRANLEGARAVLDAFAPMIAAHPDAASRRASIDAQLSALEHQYAAIGTDALPAAPADFDPDHPSDASPYGQLFGSLSHATLARERGTLAFELRAAGLAMGISPLNRPTVSPP
jgi:iron uptake system component EfeO